MNKTSRKNWWRKVSPTQSMINSSRPRGKNDVANLSPDRVSLHASKPEDYDMADTIVNQTEELGRLERAAEESTRPEDIPVVAKRSKHHRHAAVSKFWFVPYLVAGAVLGLGAFVNEWQESWFSPQTAARIHRYLVGGLGAACLLAAARAVDIYAINRL